MNQTQRTGVMVQFRGRFKKVLFCKREAHCMYLFMYLSRGDPHLTMGKEACYLIDAYTMWESLMVAIACTI